MASGGLPHQPLQAAILARFAKDSLAQANAGLLDSTGPATTSPPEIHSRHLMPDERDAFISWLREEFAAVNAIIDAMCHHLRMTDEPSEYDLLFTCIQQRRYNWTLVLDMQQFFSVAEISHALQQATWRRHQARNSNQVHISNCGIEDLKDPRVLNVLRGLKGEVPNLRPQTEVSLGDMVLPVNRDISRSDLPMAQEMYNGKIRQSPMPKLTDCEASRSLCNPSEQSASQVSSPLQTATKSPAGKEIIVDSEITSSMLATKPPGQCCRMLATL